MTSYVNDETLEALRRWEGLVLYAYDDADRAKPPKFIRSSDDVAGTLTIGYGHTKTVTKGQRIDVGKAEALLRQDANEAAKVVMSRVKVPLSPNQLGALTSFVFNVGEPKFASSTLLRELNKGNYDRVPIELAKWNKTTINGKLVPSPGLVNRRSVEIGLWGKGSTVASNTVEASVDAPPPVNGAVATAGGVGAVGTAVAVVQAFQGTDWKVALVLIGGALVGGAVWYLLKRRAQ